MTHDPEDLLARVASFGLDGPQLAPPDHALPTAAWHALIGQVRRERQWGALAWAIADGWWPASDQQADEAYLGHRSAMATVLRIEQRILELHAACEERGLRFVVLKGSAVAHLDHADPSLRSFADVDLLVAGDDLATLEALLAKRGGRRRYDEPRAGFDARFSKGFSMRLPDGIEVDVHRTLALGPFGLRIRPDALLERTTPFSIGGADLAALDRRGRFFHACVHGALGSAVPAMTARRDVVAVCGAGGDDICSAIDLAEDWGLGIVPALAVHDAATTFAWRPPAPVCARIDALVPSAREWAWMEGYRDHRSSARHALDSVQAIDGWADRLRYGLAALAPNGRGSLTRVRRAVRDIRPS